MPYDDADDAVGVSVVTGDTKVVERGSADKLFINTAGIGVVPAGVNISAARAQARDKVIVNGYLGDHGCAILLARNEHALETDVETDCQSLADLVRAMLAVCPDIHCLRDATRGGLATVLNEFAQSSRVGIRVEENQLLLCFDVCAKGTVVEGAQLEILEIAGLAICRQCRAEVVLQQLFGRCACGSNDLEQIAGSELKVKEMETI